MARMLGLVSGGMGTSCTVRATTCAGIGCEAHINKAEMQTNNRRLWKQGAET
jgi:hypothetical protein